MSEWVSIERMRSAFPARAKNAAFTPSFKGKWLWVDVSPFVLRVWFNGCASFYRESTSTTHGYRSNLAKLIST